MDTSERKVVVITGATAGVGRATAEAFARRGWAVSLLARDHAALDATCALGMADGSIRTATSPA